MNRKNELTELKQKRDAILKRCEYWKTCNDGSYGMALHHAGYAQINEQIKLIEAEYVDV